ncbi:MAG: rhodanese-like domain-containing protein [bacterium]|nr:rhodanese-like domain-containing protein [bacterium]
MKQNKGKWLVVWVATALLLSITGATYAGEWANPDLLVDADTVKANIDKADWVVVDCRDLKDYAKGHIPGAISFGNRCKKVLRDPTSRVLQDTSKYEKLLGKAGIGNDTHVVFYYDGLGTLTDATVGFWVMEYLGHDKAHVLNGGLEAWRNAGNRLVKEPTMKEPKTFKANVVMSRLAATDEIEAIAAGKGNSQLVDSRSGKEHVGKDIRAVRGGHVPNTTINASHIDTLKQEENKKTGKMEAVAYLDPDAAEKAFGSLDKNKRTVAYCQTGTRSTMTYLQLRLLGFKDPANWDDSWRVYGSMPDSEIEDEQYYNFAGTNKKIKKLEKTVKKLEDQLNKLQGAGK